jgi:putative outer membrane autotransporter barrel domain protein
MKSQTVLMSSSLRGFHIYLYGAFLCTKESAETVVVSVRSLLFYKGEYIMKLSQKKWKSLISGVLLAASASSFLIAPVYAADYSKPLIGTLKKDSEILSPDGNTVTENDGKLIYDFQGKDHTFTITNKDGITARKDSVYNNVGADGSYGTLHIYQTNNKSNAWAGVNGFTANKGIIVVNSNLDITATSEYSSVGIAAANKGNLIINGNVKMRTDNAEKPWGIITGNVHGNVGPGGSTSMGGDANYTGARWQPAGISVDYTRGDVTVNGDVDIAVRGTAVRTDAYQADGDVPAYDLGTISLLGNSIRIDTPYREENFVEGFGKFIEPYYALASYGGTINVNVKNQAAQNGKVEMVGNVLAMKSSDEAGKAMVYQNGRLNIGLTTQDSSWKGVIDNAGTAKAGEVNLWLQNGAQWIYENASRKDGLDASNLANYSRPYYEKYDGISHLSSLVGGKDKASAGIIKVNDNDPIHIANAEGVTKVWYEHDDATPGTIIGGDVKVLNAKAGTEMMLYTGNNGISKGFAEGDTAAEKNNVSEVLNSLAHKLWYMAGDSNLTGSVSIAEGLTASSVTMKTGNITFAEGGQGFYDYTPEKDDKTYATGPIVKSENIGETRESDINGVVSVNVTEAQDGVSGNAPSAMYAAGDAVSPLVIDLQGHTLKLNANNQTANYVSTVYVDENKSMEIKDSKGNGVLKVSAGLGADGNADTKAKYVYGIRVGEGGNLTANTDVEIDGVKSSATQRAYGVYVSTKGNVVFEKDLTIKNVQTGNKVGPNTAGIYADSSSSADAPINITVKGNLNIENVLGSAIRALNTSTISTAGATIKAADMSNGTDYSQYYALQANKGIINLNTGEGITAGILDVTGDMKVTDNKASVINVNMTKGSQWTGAVSNIPGSTYNAPTGQFNLTMAKGSVWNHETGRSVDTLKTTFAGSNVSKLDGSGVIYQNSDKGITVYDYSGDTTVVYGHDADNPQNITGGDFTVKTADDGSKITLVTDSQGINAGFEASDTATEKNNVKEVLNKLANKLFYTGYKDANLDGVVKIADGLTASSVSAIVKASGDITFSDGSNGTKKAGQGFYDYTPEEDKPDYKTGAITKSENISLNREVDDKGVAHINVTESNAGNNKFASALYAGEETYPSKPMTVNMSGKGLALNVAQTGGQAAAIYAGANTYIKVINPSAEQKLSITANNTDTRGSHGVYADGNAHLNIYGPVEITDIVTKGDSATGINIQGQKSEINIDGPLTISNVKGIRERGAGMNASGIQVTGDTSTVTVSGPVDISGVRGSGIRLTGKDTKVAVGGGTITAAEDSDKSHNFYAVRVDKGTLDINMKDGAAGDTTTKITGDMYATGQYGKKVVEYTGGELINWNDAGVLNVALTDKDSFWKGVAAYDMYNSDYGSGGNTMHDIGQFNLYLQNGATWTNEQQSHVTTTTIASKNPVWTGSTLATLHGGKDADNAGLIYQKDNNPISVVNYSGHTTVFYEHDANDPTKIIGGSFNITNAAEGSAITFITDNKGITSGFADGDSTDAKDNVANVLNNLAGKLFYKNYTDGHLAGVVKIAEGLTASSAALKTGDISFSTEETGTFTPGQGYYDYKTSKPGSQITKEFTTAITGDAAADTVYIEKGVLKDDGTYVFTADSTTITPEKHLIAGGAWLPQISAAISGSDENHNVTIDMNGNKLTVDTTTDTHTTGIAAVGKGAVNINNAGAMSVSATSTTNGQTGALFVNAGGTINIHNAGADNVLTLRASSAAPANAAVIKSMNGVSGVMSAITVDGLVDILADKSNASGANEAISAVASKVEIGGGVIKVINGAEYAISAYGEFASKNRGQVNVNVKKDAEGAIIGAGNNNVQMEGNVNLGGGMDSAGASADVSIGLNTRESFWKGDVSNTNGSSAGIVNLYMGNGASWTGNNLSGNTVNANLDNATWTGYSNGNAMHLKLDNSIWNVNGASKLASFSGNNGSIIVANNAGDINVAEYSGNTNVIYNHDADNPTNILGGSFTIGKANTGSNITLITDNKGITKGFNAYDKAEDQNTVNEVLNKLAQKLFYTANDGKLAGIVKIASGLTASSAALKTGDISFSTDATGTKTPGQGFYEYTEMDDSVITDPITGNLDKKYVSLGIETEKGIYNFTKDTVINVTKGDYSSNLSAIESSGGPITINADGHSLDVAYHVLKGSNVARAVATGLSYGKSKDITIKAKSLKLSTDTTGFRAQGVYATGGKITIDADTTITTSAQTESNGIYSGSGGTVTMNGNLDIQKDSKAANYIALNSDDNGIINVNVKNGKAGAGIVKIDGDVFTKSAETYDYWEDETTSTSSTVNLALQGKDSSWNGRSLYEVTSGDDSTSYGTFNLWLTDGATWTNEKNGKEVPNGFNGSHVTNFTGGADAAHAGNIFQKDSKNLTVDNYSGNTNIFYAHTGNGEAAADYKAGDTVIKHAAEGSVVSLITDNSGIAMDNEYSIANVLNTLAGKLTYSNFVNGENNLTGYVKIADGLTASSKAMQTGDISFSSKDGKGSLKDGSITPGLTYPDTQTPESSKLNSGITGDAKADYQYKKDGILKEDGSYVFTQDPTVIEVKEGAAVNATAKDIVIDTTKAKLELKGADAGINAVDANVNIKGDTNISGETGIIANNSNVTMAGGSKIIGRGGKAISALGGGKVRIESNLPLYIRGLIYARSGQIYLKGGNGSNIEGDLEASDGGEVDVNLSGDGNVLWGAYRTDENSCVKVYIDEGATWNLTDGEDETKAEGKSLLRMAKGAAAPETGLIVKGGATDKQSGFLNMTNRSKTLDIAHYSGWETIIYNHEGAGDKVTDYKSGNTIISKADKDSGVILSTDNSGIAMNDKKAVEAALAALAQKVTYKDHEANAANLTGKVQIAEGLTSSSASQYIGKLHWDANGVGQYDKDSVNWKEIYNGDYETLVMKGVRSAATTSMHSWRDNMQDTYTGADLADADGIFVKALGGKTSSDVKGVKDDNTYRGVQVGFDKALANGWHAGVAFDYRDGDSNYLLGGKGDNQLYSLGVYGVKSFDDQSYLRVAAKAGRVENEYDVYNEIRTLKLHGDYKANAYGLTMEYGKTFGTEASYFTPKAQLTWSQVGSKDYTAHTPNDSMRIDQDAYSSLVARFGVEAGAKSEKGRVYVGLYGAHEFNGDISASYFAKDGGTKHTSFDGKDTWMEMSIGGSYDLSDNCHIYADFAKDFGGDFERKWKASAGLRFEF